MCLCLCVCVCLNLVFSLSLSLSLSLSRLLSLSLPLSLSPSLYLSLSCPLSLFLLPYLSLPPSLPLPLSLGLCELVAASEMLYTRARGVKSWDVCARELKWLRSHSKRRTEMPRIEVGKPAAKSSGLQAGAAPACNVVSPSAAAKPPPSVSSKSVTHPGHHFFFRHQ